MGYLLGFAFLAVLVARTERIAWRKKRLVALIEQWLNESESDTECDSGLSAIQEESLQVMAMNTELKCECGKKPLYSTKHDAYCCYYCNKWLTAACTDAHCDFCHGRPNKPFLESKKITANQK